MELPTDLTSRKIELHVPLPSPAIVEGNDRLLQAIVDMYEHRTFAVVVFHS